MLMRNRIREIGALTALMLAVGSYGIALAGAGKNELPKQELQRLDKAIKASQFYMRDKTRRLDSLSQELHTLPAANLKGRWELCHTLANEYMATRADSALHFSELGISLAAKGGMAEEEYRSRITHVNALSTSGIFTKALAEFDALDHEADSRERRLLYWGAGRKLYGYMRNYVADDKQYFNEYNEKYIEFDDSLMANLPQNDPYRSFYYAERLVNKGEFSEAKPILAKLCQLPENENLYGMAAYQMGWVCKAEGDQTGYAAWLAKAAVSDIRSCVKDGFALPALAEWLYHEGELNLAFEYINFALEDAMSGNVRMRTVSIATMLPVIDEAYREKINSSRDEMMIYFLLVTFLLAITIGLLVLLWRTVKRSRVASAKLSRTAALQESYIGNFIGLCSTYANKLESLQKLVTRKLAAGQADELAKMIKNGRFADEQNDEFYQIFDSAFLDIYPDFIAGVNELLKPEEQIDLKKEHELTPELRIYALVRLGVEESTRIAQILNYSVSTVYSYRNRMRNRAIDRENFDKNVMRIGKSEFENLLQ